MKSIFLDCNAQLAPVWARVIRPNDPQIDVNTTPFAREELPLLLAGYDIALDDHSYMPTELVARCKQLKHIVFLGTGAASYMNVDELKSHGVAVHTVKGYGDTAVAVPLDGVDGNAVAFELIHVHVTGGAGAEENDVLELLAARHQLGRHV